MQWKSPMWYSCYSNVKLNLIVKKNSNKPIFQDIIWDDLSRLFKNECFMSDGKSGGLFCIKENWRKMTNEYAWSLILNFGSSIEIKSSKRDYCNNLGNLNMGCEWNNILLMWNFLNVLIKLCLCRQTSLFLGNTSWKGMWKSILMSAP